MNSQSPRPLLPGQAAEFDVYSRKQWNATGVLLDRGIRYAYVVPPTEIWHDFYISTDADGYRKDYLSFWEKYRRVPSENWFRLIGMVDQEPSLQLLFSAGSDTFIAPASGHLFCFANDMATMYWNNWGRVHVILSRPSTK
jgi:hypothetical protein